MNKMLLLLCLILLFAPALSGQENKKDELSLFLKKAVKTYNIPALSISIVDDNEIIYSFNWGEIGGCKAVTSDTPFYLGSTSKTFTALAVMRLVEQGKVGLDEPVKKYLPDFTTKNKIYEQQITVRHLLNHTSGLSAKHMQGMSMGLDNLDDELKLLIPCNPIHAPGTHYEYFNSNYRVLGLLVERVSNMSFQDFMSNEIFLPLGMSGTTAGFSAGICPVSGHGQLFGLPIEREQVFRKGAVPSGYMISTASDISKFLIEELKAYNGESAHLNKETILKTWQLSDTSDNTYAMGWLVVTDSIGDKFYVHGGALEGYQSFFYLNPEKNIGFVVLMNQGGLLPMMSFNTIRDGLINLIDGKQPESGMKQAPVIIIALIFFLTLSLCAFRIRRLTRKPKQTLWRKISIILDFLITCFIIWGFIPLMNWLMGDKADWRMLWNMFPEFCLLLAIVCTCNVICGSIKIKQLFIDYEQ